MLNMHNMAPAAARHQLNLNHGRSQSSFRSYTNHHMGSGSNHCVTDLDEEQGEELGGDDLDEDEDEMVDEDGEFMMDCDTYLDSRQE